MAKSYYQTPSSIGRQILNIFEIEYKEDCINTIWHLERYRNWDFNMLNAVKYLWRAGQKDPDPRQDLAKAVEYLEWEKTRLNNVRTYGKSDSYARFINNLKSRIQLAIDTCNFAIEEQSKLFIADKDLNRYQQKHRHEYI